MSDLYWVLGGMAFIPACIYLLIAIDAICKRLAGKELF